MLQARALTSGMEVAGEDREIARLFNGTLVGYLHVDVGGAGNYQPYSLGFLAKAGDTIHVWMYSPATPGSVVIDDATLKLYTGPR